MFQFNLESVMKKQLIAAVILGALSSVASAEDTTVIPFNDLDANKDDALSVGEANSLPGITAQWITLDVDGNGQLNRGEYAGYTMPAPAAGAAENK
jgi:hypothetical protein